MKTKKEPLEQILQSLVKILQNMIHEGFVLLLDENFHLIGTGY